MALFVSSLKNTGAFARGKKRFRSEQLFPQRPQVGNGSLDVVHRKLGRLHQRLLIFLQTVLDGLDGLIIRNGGLHSGIGIILAAKLRAHLGGAFAVVAVAFGAVVGINSLAVSGESSGGQGERERRRECEECDFFHKRE